MSDFLSWYSGPEGVAERREIRGLLRCSETEAVLIQLLGDLAEQVDALGTELGAAGFDAQPPDEDDAEG